MVYSNQYYHNMQYKTYPISQSRKNRPSLHFWKSAKNWQVWDPGTHWEGEILKFRFRPLFFANWTILSHFEQKKFFRKICRKWLSLEASKHCKGSVIQKWQKKVPDFGFNHLFSRIGPFWVIWSNKKKFDFGSFKIFQKPNLTSY